MGAFWPATLALSTKVSPSDLVATLIPCRRAANNRQILGVNPGCCQFMRDILVGRPGKWEDWNAGDHAMHTEMEVFRVLTKEESAVRPLAWRRL